MMMLPGVGTLVTVNSDNILRFFKYQQENKLVLTKNMKKEVLCLTYVRAYNKVVCGLKENSIVEFTCGLPDMTALPIIGKEQLDAVSDSKKVTRI